MISCYSPLKCFIPLTTASRVLSRKTKSSRKSLLFSISLNSRFRWLGEPISAWIKVSILKHKWSRDSLVPFLGLVRWDHNMLGNSSVQFPLAFSRHFFKPQRTVWLVNSNSLLVCGCATEANCCSILSPSQKSHKFLVSNYFPLSVIRILGIPYWQMMSSKKKSWICFEVIVLSTLTSTHNVK